MFKNYFKVAVRTLMKNKLFSSINIFGLALSMSICLLVLLRLKDQLNYDKFHPNAARTYRVTTAVSDKQGNAFHFATSPLPFSEAFSRDYDMVENSTRLFQPGNHEAVIGRKRLSIRMMFSDAGFFSVFGFKLGSGNPHTALVQPNSIVLSSEMAGRFFGKEAAMGQVITLKDWGDFKVTGIVNQPPGKSHIEFDALLSMSSVATLEKTGRIGAAMESWNNLDNDYTYLTLRRGVNEKQFSRALDKFSAGVMKTASVNGKESIRFLAQPFNDIILGEEMYQNLGNTGSKGKVWAEIGIAFVILLSACFNYMNLSIARSFHRGKEIGVRKVSGAFRIHIFWQFILESLLVSLLALGLAYVILQLMIDYAPFSQELIPRNFSFDFSLFCWFFAFASVTGVVAGALPAWALSSFKPIEVLKNLSTIKLFGGNVFRKGLIITQFSLSLVIIIFSQLFSRQFAYMENADPGFARADRLRIPIRAEDYAVLSTEIGRIKGVESVAAVSGDFGWDAAGYCKIKRGISDNPFSMADYDIDTAFLRTMKLRLIAGTNFPVAPTQNREQFVVINEKAAKLLQFQTAEASIGQPIWMDDTLQVAVAGVVADFYFLGVDQPVQPLIFRSRSNNFSNLNIQLSSGNKNSLAAIEELWKKYNPAQAFTYSWMQEQPSAWNTLSMLGFLGFIAVTLACLGLLGMVTYSIERRRKEIGIRKVMGAGAGTIVTILSRGFLRLVIIAGFIAIPISYILGYLFLNIFANRVSPGFMMQILSFIALLLLALLTMGIQVYRASMDNPVKALRTE